MTGNKKKQQAKEDASEQSSDTPRVEKSEISKRNLLKNLSVNVPEERTPAAGGIAGVQPANQLSFAVTEGAAAVGQVVNPLPPTAAVSAVAKVSNLLPVVEENIAVNAHINNQDPTLSVAYQKQADRSRKEQKEMERTVENLLDRQDLIIEKLLRIQESIKTETANNIHYLNLQLQTIQRAYDEFDAVQTDLLVRIQRELRGGLNQKYLNFEKLHGELYVKVQTMITTIQRADSSRALSLNANASEFQPRPQVVSSAPHLQVPLPTFDGKLENWYSFKSMFRTVMDRYPNESSAIKLYHLKNSLIGSASGKIDQDIINNNDYESAWRMLEDAYEDQRLIIDTHIDALLDLPKIARENGDELRKLVETCTKNVDALKNHDLPVEGLSEMMLINIISKRLDRETRKLWESSLAHDDLPSYDDLIAFLKDRSRVLQKLSAHAPTSQPQTVAKPRQQKVFVQTNNETCPCCSHAHNIYKCDTFKKLPIPERYEKVKRAGLCFNCLRPGHRTVDCKTDKQCKTCGKRHHSYLHQQVERSEDPRKPADDPRPKSPVRDEKKTEKPVEQRTVSCCTQTQAGTKQIFLSTAKVFVAGSGNATVTCRALLDCCSESNVITEKLAAKLNLRPSLINPPIVICGLNGMTTTTNKIIQTKVSSRDGDFSVVLDFLVTPAITELPSGKVDTNFWPLPAGVELADSSFNVPDAVDMIIGAEVFYDILKKGRVKIGGDFPTLAETAFGWVVSGPVTTTRKTNPRKICQLNITLEEVNRNLSRFWELEAGYITTKMSATERAVEQHFEETHSRDRDGRYIVRLPFNDLQSQLGDSYEFARRRLERQMNSLAKNPSRKQAYSDFMEEYLALGHMQEVSENPDQGYFLPHHAVYKESSSTTKIRVVFDASAVTSTGVSLNDTQLVGPTVQSDLITLILRFCTHEVVLTGDVPKMYRQVYVHPADRQYLRIIWLDHKNEIATFEMTTVTYGCSSSPYLATRVLMQLATDEGNDLPLAARVVKEDSYIDDFITGGRTDAEVIQVYAQLTELLKRGGFGVHKFCSNSPEVLRAIPVELQEKQVDFESSELNNTIKTLGLVWNPSDDYFAFSVPQLIPNQKLTKRTVLSEIGRVYDPLGFLGPVGTLAKLTMQELWRLKLEWDDELPDEQMGAWIAFREQLVSIRKIRMKRCVIHADAKLVELHGFCDASKRAYGACLYVRCVLPDGRINVQLLCSKSRVAPLKPVTIPRLELCAALVLAQLTQKTMEALRVNFDSVTLWSDSQIVLSWLKKSPLVLNEFVCNRVVSIIELTPNFQWHYVRSENNPADALSRGMLPEQLIENRLWWSGSPELWRPRALEEQAAPLVPDEDLPEIRKRVFVNVCKEPAFYFGRVSKFSRLHRAWAYVWRFIDNTRKKTKNCEPLSAWELSRASNTIWKLVQKEAFKDVLDDLEADAGRRCKLSGLAPFVDQDGIIRVGGRLKYSHIPYESKHQILLPDKHHVTYSLVRHLHEHNLHVGQNGLISIVRQQYWPVKLKSIVKQIVGRCYVCYRHKPQQLNQCMGDLPSYRVTPSPVFAKTGVDFAGPFVLKESGRKPKFYKAYVCVFVCMTTKAVHLELCSDLRSETFLGALLRFVGRYGYPSDLYSDNGTTFVGANNELEALRKLFESQDHKDKVAEFCSSRAIAWHFIPPRSPHFGGIWEAGVKSMKYLLKRVVGETRLTYEEMATFLAQAEAIMNSRPLCPMSDDPNDLETLTPFHFLIGRPGLAIPEPSYSQEKLNRLSRWEHVQLMREHFWNRWSVDYLHTLQTRQKWKDGVLEFKIGSLVLLRDENVPPQQWRMGRIVSTHPGKDGVVRVVDVKTATGEYRRAVAKICLLPDVVSNDPTGGE